ncbi:carbohydrate esterase family 4 protein [Mycena polygramma]|nr:carbohydrate esterase family 4 protein [Mycena polygramma]
MRTTLLLAALVGSGTALTLTARDGTSATLFTGCLKEGYVAMTFDDGPWKYHKNVSDTCTAAGANVTFFVNGLNYDCIYNDPYPGWLADDMERGHQIASHTWSHKDMTTLSQAELDDEIDKPNSAFLALPYPTRSYDVESAVAFQKILGVKPAFLRPPYGNCNDTVLAALGQRGMNAATWDFDSGDSTGSSAADSKKAYDQRLASNPTGNILALNHETMPTTVTDVLPYAISALQAKKYKLVTLATCLGSEPYLPASAPETSDFSWHC